MLNTIVLYLDLDGVLVDWDSGFERISGGISGKEYSLKHGKDAIYSLVNGSGSEWWANLNWMPDGKRLWEYANENFLHIKILSALGIPDENIKDGKLEWIGRNLRNIDADDIILVVNSTDKIKYAGQNQILVDDKEKTITSWIAAGGIGILHKNTNKTIQKLTKYI